MIQVFQYSVSISNKNKIFQLATCTLYPIVVDALYNWLKHYTKCRATIYNCTLIRSRLLWQGFKFFKSLRYIRRTHFANCSLYPAGSAGSASTSSWARETPLIPRTRRTNSSSRFHFKNIFAYFNNDLFLHYDASTPPFFNDFTWAEAYDEAPDWLITTVSSYTSYLKSFWAALGDRIIASYRWHISKF